MRTSRTLAILVSVLFVFGLAATVQAETPDYVIFTAFTDKGEPTWSPPVVVVDLDTIGHAKFVTLKVDNVSAEDFGFRIDGLDIMATVPVREERVIQIPTDKPGIYRMYSDLHNQARATTGLMPNTRLHVAGWLVIGSKGDGDRFYLDMVKYFGESLEVALRQVRSGRLHQKHFSAFAAECEIQLDMLRWTTSALWDPAIAAPEDRGLAYGELYSIVNEEIRPGFHAMFKQMKMKQVGRHASLSRAIKKLEEVQSLIAVIPGGMGT